ALISAATAFIVDHDQLAVGMMSFLGLIVVGVALRPASSTWPLVVAGVVTWQTVAPMENGWLDPALIAALSVAVLASTREIRSVRAHIAAGLMVVAAGWAVEMGPIEDVTFALAALVVGAALSGLAAVDPRCAALQSGGVVASVMAVGSAASVD